MNSPEEYPRESSENRGLSPPDWFGGSSLGISLGNQFGDAALGNWRRKKSGAAGVFAACLFWMFAERRVAALPGEKPCICAFGWLQCPRASWVRS